MSKVPRQTIRFLRVRYGSWFQFNDDEVTRINVLGDKAPKKRDNERDAVTKAEKWVITHYIMGDTYLRRPEDSEAQRRRALAKKQRRIEDSDNGGDSVELE